MLQEDEREKAAWLDDAKRRIPPGTRVCVVASDLEEYVGKRGTVADYDVGTGEDWPLVGVVFDTPAPSGARRDGFYCDGDPGDEIVPERDAERLAAGWTWGDVVGEREGTHAAF